MRTPSHFDFDGFRFQLFVQSRPLALGAGEEQFVRVRHQRGVIGAGMIDECRAGQA